MVGVDWPFKGTIYAYAIIQENCLSSHSCYLVKTYVCTKLLHAYVKYVYIVQVKYWINSSKAVIGVDWPMKVLSMHIYTGKNVLIAVILSK